MEINTHMNQNNYTKLRLLNDSKEDYQKLYKWYKNPKVNTYFEQKELTLEEIIKKYKQRTSLGSKTPVFMIEYKQKPIGIIQYTKLTDKTKEKYQVKKEGYDIDIFIGENKYHHKGIGQTAIKLLIDKLLTKNNILIMVPETRNFEAINCYKKLGFSTTNIIYELDSNNENLQEKILMIFDCDKA